MSIPSAYDMPRLVNDEGQKGVIVSSDYGCGFWELSQDHQHLRLYKPLVEALLDSPEHFLEVLENLGLTRVFFGDILVDGSPFYTGLEDAQVEWIPENAAFSIKEHHGYEEIKIAYNTFF